MKTWISILPIAALVVAVAGGCERRDQYTQKTGEKTGEGYAERTGNAPTAATPREDYGTRTGVPPRTGAIGEEEANTAPNAPGSAARVVTGTLDVKDESMRTFQLDGDATMFVAPSGADLDSLDGKDVTVRIDPTGRVESIEQRSTDRPS